MALAPLPVPRSAPRGGRHILVADDDPGIRAIVTLNLEADGFEVTVVDDGTAALSETTRLLPDLVVLDVMMPGLDGYAVLRALKDDVRTAPIPIVLLTAKATDGDVWEGWRSGADYYMTKPFHPEELSDFARQLLGPWA